MGWSLSPETMSAWSWCFRCPGRVVIPVPFALCFHLMGYSSSILFPWPGHSRQQWLMPRRSISDSSWWQHRRCSVFQPRALPLVSALSEKGRDGVCHWHYSGARGRGVLLAVLSKPRPSLWTGCCPGMCVEGKQSLALLWSSPWGNIMLLNPPSAFLCWWTPLVMTFAGGKLSPNQSWQSMKAELGLKHQ